MEFLKSILPFIGAAATGNVPALIAMAANAVGDAIGVDVEQTAAAITKAVTGATPEQLLALRTAESDFALNMKALGIQSVADLERIAADNTKDARSMQIQTRSWVPAALAIMVTLGFFGILIAMITGETVDSDQQALLVMLGALGAAWGSIINFFYGSSSGSQQKDAMLANRK